MAQTYTYSKANPVYFAVGKFTGTQDGKYLKAPFDTVLINGVLYLQPQSFRFSTEGGVAQTANADAELARLSRQQFGFYWDLQPVVVQEQDMGCKDDSTSWKGMHKFGWV